MRTTLLAITLALTAIAALDGRVRAAALAGLSVAYGTVLGCGVTCLRMQFFCPAACRGGAGRMRVALTFDDGPDPAATPALLELLKREGIAAAFFCIGKNAAAHPRLAARIATEGHLLGNHTYRHSWWGNFMLGSGWIRELTRTQETIEKAAGVTPVYMRPPFGLTNPHLGGALRKTGLKLVGWDVRPFDTVCSTRTIMRRIRRGTRDGSIILLHDGGAAPERVVEIASATISELRLRGFAFERLDILLGQNPPPPSTSATDSTR